MIFGPNVESGVCDWTVWPIDRSIGSDAVRAWH